MQILISENINCERYWKLICLKNPEILQEIENNISRDNVSVLRKELRFMSRNICNFCEVFSEARARISRVFSKDRKV
jgi:hypothetical protein